MWRTIDEKLIRFSIRHLGHIPPGTQVDPAEFPEDDYPVRCLQCGYTLRGLPDGRCPECGKEFQRGLLLVEEYARGRRPKGDRQVRIASRALTGIMIVSTGVPMAIFFLGLGLVGYAPQWTATNIADPPDLVPWIVRALYLLMIGLIAGNLVGFVVALRLQPPRKKARPVRDAARKRARATLAANGPKTSGTEP